MSLRTFPAAVLAAVVFATTAAAPAAAQPLGVFRWQLQPFCNVLTVTVVPSPDSGFRLEGFDDQCGAPLRAPAVGVATLNPDGSIGVGVHLVVAPSGRAVSIDARVNPGNGDGTWKDSAGNSGRFALGATSGGQPRPLPTIPTAAIAAGSISAAQLAPGVIGTVAQARIGGLCTNGQAMRGINPDGSVACTNAATTVDDAANNVGQYSAIAIGADGLPIVAYHDATASTLLVMHCGDSACVAGNRITPVTVAGRAMGRHASIAIGTDGLPVIAFSDADDDQLQILHCGAVDCERGNVMTSAPAPGEYTDIVIGADGLPIISRYDTGHLLVTHCSTITCTAHTTTRADVTADNVGRYTSIAIGADGLPIISHLNLTTNTLRVTHCGNVTCTANNVSTNIDQPLSGAFTSIAIGRDGLPIIAAAKDKDGLLMTHCTTVTCAAGHVSTHFVGEAYSGGFHNSIAIAASGLPIVSHAGVSHDVLLVTHCANLACTSAATARVDSLDRPHGTYSSMAIGRDGLPIVSHYVRELGALRVTKCGTATCQ